MAQPPRPRPLDPAELDRQLADLPGVHRGAQTTLALAVRAPSFADAVRLVDLVAQDADAMDHHPEVHLRLRVVTFTFTSNLERAVTQWDVELAHRVLEAARSLGAEVLPPPQRVEIALECADADGLRPFWAAGLRYVERRARDGSVELHDRGGRGPVLWFQPTNQPAVPEDGTGRGRFHLDVFVPAEEAPERVRACLAAGGVVVSDAHAPARWVLADPEGNELCVRTAGAVPQGAGEPGFRPAGA
jgi:4a-hydroxytetrahydrobiopterin dehydratase